jgi:peroxiredoxin
MTTARNHPRQRTTTIARRPGGSRKARPASAGRTGARRPSGPQLNLKEVKKQQARRRARRATLLWSATALVAAGLITAAVLVTSSPGALQHNTVRTAPAFTLTATNGKTVSLASYWGRNVVLYFNEGAGCDACFYQMRQFEQHAAQLTKAGITILPIVMNPASQIRPELASFGLHTPYLIDTTGAVSRAYGVLGKGMHAGLPGHGFVLIDAHSTERWYGEYPSMYLSAAGLIQQVHAHLHT